MVLAQGWGSYAEFFGLSASTNWMNLYQRLVLMVAVTELSVVINTMFI